MKLKELRENAGLSQAELAAKLGIKQATYSNYENGVTKPTVDIASSIADYYGVSLDYLCQHKIEGQIQIGILDEISKELISLVLKLNEEQRIKLIGYINCLIGDS